MAWRGRKQAGSFSAVLRWGAGGFVVGALAGSLASQRFPLAAGYFFGLLTGACLILFRGAAGGSLRQIGGSIIGMLLFGSLFGLLLHLFGPLPEGLHGGWLPVPAPVPFAVVLFLFFLSILLGSAWATLPPVRRSFARYLTYAVFCALFVVYLVLTYPLVATWEEGRRQARHGAPRPKAPAKQAPQRRTSPPCRAGAAGSEKPAGGR